MATSFLKLNLPWGTHVGNRLRCLFALANTWWYFWGCFMLQQQFFLKKISSSYPITEVHLSFSVFYYRYFSQLRKTLYCPSSKSPHAILCWGRASEPCGMLSACTSQLQEPVQLQVPRKNPERSPILQGSGSQRLSSPTAVSQLPSVIHASQEGFSWP